MLYFFFRWFFATIFKCSLFLVIFKCSGETISRGDFENYVEFTILQMLCIRIYSKNCIIQITQLQKFRSTYRQRNKSPHLHVTKLIWFELLLAHSSNVFYLYRARYLNDTNTNTLLKLCNTTVSLQTII